MLSSSSARRLAVVPFSSQVFGDILMRVHFSFSWYLDTKSNTTYAVIILVKLATYQLSFSFLPKRNSPVFKSNIDQAHELTKGVGLSTNNYFIKSCSFELDLMIDLLYIFFFLFIFFI